MKYNEDKILKDIIEYINLLMANITLKVKIFQVLDLLKTLIIGKDLQTCKCD